MAQHSSSTEETMNRPRIAVLTLVAALAASTPLLAANPAADEAAMKKEAKISMTKAKEIALAKVPGKVESSELEREHGTLIYSFDIRNAGGTITEVAVSAINGKVVAVEHESKAREDEEKKQEARERAKGKKKN
jgi:peptidase YpeB-like protein